MSLAVRASSQGRALAVMVVAIAVAALAWMILAPRFIADGSDDSTAALGVLVIGLAAATSVLYRRRQVR